MCIGSSPSLKWVCPLIPKSTYINAVSPSTQPLTLTSFVYREVVICGVGEDHVLLLFPFYISKVLKCRLRDGKYNSFFCFHAHKPISPK